MKKTNIFFWIFTILLAGLMLFSAIPDILMVPDAIKFMTDLGYPHYFIPFIGVAKVLGSIAILVPRYPRLHEWAYAGIFFDLFGAVYSALASGATVVQCLPFLLFFGLLFGSYIFWHRRLKLKAAASLR